MSKQINPKGFTLLEMLLVLVIISTIIVMLFGYLTQQSAESRRVRTIMELQQLLNAAMAYYVNNSQWPTPSNTCPVNASKQVGSSNTPISILQAGNYIFSATPKNPWGNFFGMSCDPTTGRFWVYTNVTNSTDAAIIAGRLPLGSVANGGGVTNNPPYWCSGSTSCTYVVASVAPPVQTLNNARSINYAGVYNSGGCVPAPVCPLNMTKQIFVTPAAASGVNDSSSPSTVYPMGSITAYAVGSGSPPVPVAKPPACNGIIPGPSCGTSSDPTGTTYWRVCLQIVTEKGTVTPPTSSSSFGSQGVNMGSIMAVTRCAPMSETPIGTRFPYFMP